MKCIMFVGISGFELVGDEMDFVNCCILCALSLSLMCQLFNDAFVLVFLKKEVGVAGYFVRNISSEQCKNYEDNVSYG